MEIGSREHFERVKQNVLVFCQYAGFEPTEELINHFWEAARTGKPAQVVIPIESSLH